MALKVATQYFLVLHLLEVELEPDFLLLVGQADQAAVLLLMQQVGQVQQIKGLQVLVLSLASAAAVAQVQQQLVELAQQVEPLP
jgi:uncharacterized membrane protein YkvA (DUF1232 family)